MAKGSGVARYFRNGKLPNDAKYISNGTGRARTRIEEILLAKYGHIPLYCDAVLQSAMRHETRVQLLQRWLRTEPGLTLEQRITITSQISSATDSRDKCLERLKLDKIAEQGSEGVDWDDYYRRRPPVKVTDISAEASTTAKADVNDLSPGEYP